jgi:hypothetical protein
VTAPLEAKWEIVDAHRCTACGHLDTNGYRMVEHLRTHAQALERDEPQRLGTCRVCRRWSEGYIDPVRGEWTCPEHLSRSDDNAP